MNIGIITVRGSDYHPTRRLHEAAVERGHQVTVVHPYQVWPRLENGKHRLLGQPSIESLDVIMPRQGATVGDSCLALIRHLNLMGIPLVNDLDAILLAKNQFLTLMTLTESDVPVPETVFVNSAEGLQKALDKLGGYPVVVKQVSGRQGKGIHLVNNRRDKQQICQNHLDQRKGLIVQPFIPPKGRQDIRVFVIGGKTAAAMELVPREGDFRANFHLSCKSQPKDLLPEIEETALKAAETVGLEIAGVDIIVDQHDHISVIETNYSPGFRGLEAATGLDIAGRIVDYVANKYGNSSPVEKY
jgi:ribosomal protein S6--L-glutamate ligase